VNHSPLHADLHPPEALTRHPHHRPVSGFDVPLAADRRVFPIRPTPATNRGYLPDTLDESGRIREFTSACSPWIYRGAWFPPGWRGDAFVCEPAGHLLQRLRITDDGWSRTAARAWPDRDFLASTDERFRPVALAEGPDGALYVADLYRGVIQDAPHMSPYLREHSLARGLDRPIHLGRIWRLHPSAAPAPPWQPLSGMDDAALVRTLAHPSGFWRDQAQRRLVFARRDGAVPHLRKLLQNHPDERVRLHALWTLQGLGRLPPDWLLGAAADSSSHVAAAALGFLAEQGHPLPPVREPHPRVRLQRILHAGPDAFPDSNWLEVLARDLRPVVSDALFRDAALSSLSGHESDFLAWIDGDPEWRGQDPGIPVLWEMLARAVVARRDSADVARLLARLPEDGLALDGKAKAVLAGIASHSPGLRRDPIRLEAAPRARSRVAAWFEWPGHQRNRTVVPAARDLSPEEAARFAHGRQLYLTVCAACHGPDGEGVRAAAPPLAGSDWVTGSPERLVRVLLHGLTGPITVSGEHYDAPGILPMMPPLAALDNEATAAVLTYLRRAWDHAADPVSPQTVNRVRIEAQGRLTPWTQPELEPFSRAP
jgi:mono/diheme cytochrome c family protein